MSADNFRILDSQHAGFGGIASSSSSSFRLAGAIGDIAIGSSSAASFGLQAGFLSFQLNSTPTPTPTPLPTPTPEQPTTSSSGGGGGIPASLPTQSPVPSCPKSADLNTDGRVDLVDFSMLAFWWGQPIASTEPSDLNCDGQITLADFSIMQFFATD
jgi:hypothetical protein